MTLTPLSRYDLLSPDLDASIKRMKSLSVDTVALVFYHFQDTDKSTRIFLDYSRYSADPTALAAAVKVIHANGLKVLLKPHIGLNNNQFRGIIQPSPAYLASYRAHILEWTAWATEHAVDAMCIGAELKGLEPAAAFWRALVADVRGLFRGPVTYAANWDSYQTITWNDALDFIGIDTYFPLLPPQNPPVQHTLSQLLSGWSWVFAAMSDWHARTAPDQAVVFLETGCRSIRGAASAPWDSEVAGTVDTAEQSRYYRSIFAMAGRYPWVVGYFPWHWEAAPEHGGPNDGGYTLWGKPAAAVVGWFYRGGAEVIKQSALAPSQAESDAAANVNATAEAEAEVAAEAEAKAAAEAEAKAAAKAEAKAAAEAQVVAEVQAAAEAQATADAQAAAEVKAVAEAEAMAEAKAVAEAQATAEAQAAAEARAKVTAAAAAAAAAAARSPAVSAAAAAAAATAARSAAAADAAADEAVAALTAAAAATAAASAAVRTASVDAAAARALMAVADADGGDGGGGGDGGAAATTSPAAAAAAVVAALKKATASAAAASAAMVAAGEAKAAATTAAAASAAAEAVAAADAAAAKAAAAAAGA